MGNYEHTHFHHHHQNPQIKTTFLPLICTARSLKDVKLPQLENPSSSTSTDPLSPKISCIGQLKRTNKIISFPTTSHKLLPDTTKPTLSNTTTTPSLKHFSLKKLFSSKNLTVSATTTATTATTRCGSRRQLPITRSSSVIEKFSIVDLDPPLPVIKRAANKAVEGSEVDSLWKRRSRGIALQCLQVQQIQHPTNDHRLQPTTV